MDAFEEGIAELIKSAFTTETFHHRMITSLENPLSNLQDMTLVLNGLGQVACIETSDTEEAVNLFLNYCAGQIKSKMVSEFFAEVRTCVSFASNNTDHNESIGYFVDPQLLDQSGDRYKFLFLKLEELAEPVSEQDKKYPRLLRLGTNEETALKDFPSTTDADIRRMASNAFYDTSTDMQEPPCICIAVHRTNDWYLPNTAFVVAQEISGTVGDFPVFFGT